MKATRVDHGQPHRLQPGEYTKCGGHWYLRCPGPADLLANLSGHDVTENADGTITVEPSILCRGGPRSEWHGFLRQGVLSEA